MQIWNSEERFGLRIEMWMLSVVLKATEEGMGASSQFPLNSRRTGLSGGQQRATERFEILRSKRKCFRNSGQGQSSLMWSRVLEITSKGVNYREGISGPDLSLSVTQRLEGEEEKM